jgi:Tfp pilus assembly protein PilP
VEKLLRAPAAIGKNLREIGEAAKAKLSEPTRNPTNLNQDLPSTNEQKTNLQERPHASSPGRRDPFRPFASKVRPNLPSSIRPRENVSPLEQYELGQLKLIGVIWNSKEPTAMVEDSAGLGYILKVGTPIGRNEGIVKAIRPNEVMIEESYEDFTGAKKKRAVSIKLTAD